ncbi:unnamed protein product [Acanthoscelides obtectus]|uniref:F-box domain-containing protein n=1 Tax=Acanthoscelides obtectus TaxID=200917 RepID=A0A9P0M2V6_ACAOB|nr:unnamed protein product [Acanthoscelides obtectus]CAK1635683.1 hypothetical protein AOBTE_LOCUS9438 [Acanthoscelides obtectus]
MCDLLPIEILEKILAYLDTVDLIQFCDVYPKLQFVLQNGRVIRTIDFSRKFEVINLDICQFITTKLNYNCINTLKIDGIYWIPAEDLRRLIKRLDNLKELYALDTTLSVLENDIVEYFKLRRLSLTVEDVHFEQETVLFARHLSELKYFFVKITWKQEDHATGATNLMSFFSRMKQLKELWVCDIEESLNRIDYERITVSLPNLNKLVIKTRGMLPYYDWKYLGLYKVFECKRNHFETDCIWEKVRTRGSILRLSSFDSTKTGLEKGWNTFTSLCKDLPCGMSESRKLYLGEDIMNITFTDLNFCHTVLICNAKYYEAAFEMLSSPNAISLKRLSFRSCIFSTVEQDKLKTLTNGFKKNQINSEGHSFSEVAENIKYLTELEVYTCPDCIIDWSESGYISISTFANLERLTLEVLHLVDGSFLEEIFLKCGNLRFFSLTCENPNEMFFFNLCRHLRHASALRDFRLVYKKIAIDTLIKSFNSMRDKKLQRIFLSCEYIRYACKKTGKNIYAEFFQENPQLVLFFLVASKQTGKQNNDIQKTLNEYRDHPSKVFLMHKDISFVKTGFPIPSAHHDIVFNRTNVSVVHFEEFSTISS